jgi:hypothetical protein
MSEPQLIPITRETILENVCNPIPRAFAMQCIESGLDVPTECAKHHPGYLSWLIGEGFNCESARTPFLTWDSEGHMTYTVGDYALITSGYKTQITAGDCSTIAGCGDSALACGDYSTVIAGERSTVTAGEGSSIIVRWFNESGRYRFTAHYVDENGIKPNTPYRCNEDGSLTEVKP